MNLGELLKKRILRNKLILLDRKTKFAEHFFSAFWLALRRRISQLFVVKIPHLLGRPEFVGATAFFGLPMKVLRRDKFCMDTWGVIGGGTDILTVRFFVDAVEKGATVIDGGAYIGWYAALAAELVGPAGSVHAFEPTPDTFSILEENLAGKRNVYLNKAALARVTSPVELYDFGDYLGYANTISSQEGSKVTVDGFTPLKPVRRTNVEAVSLDDYCFQRRIRPDLLKLDLEGGEYDSLLGAKEVLRTHKPILVIEVSKWGIESGAYGTMADFLRGYGYRAYRMSTDEDFNLYLLPLSARDTEDFNLENIIFSTSLQTLNSFSHHLT